MSQSWCFLEVIQHSIVQLFGSQHYFFCNFKSGHKQTVKKFPPVFETCFAIMLRVFLVFAYDGNR